MTPSANDNSGDQHPAIRQMSGDEMESVSGGFLPIPPIHGGPVPIPILPAAKSAIGELAKPGL